MPLLNENRGSRPLRILNSSVCYLFIQDECVYSFSTFIIGSSNTVLSDRDLKLLGRYYTFIIYFHSIIHPDEGEILRNYTIPTRLFYLKYGFFSFPFK